MDDNQNNKSNNKLNMEPSTDADVNPSGGIKDAAKQKGRELLHNIKEAIGRGIKAIWSVLPIHIKIIVLVVIVIIVIIVALVMMGSIKEETTVVSNSVSDYFESEELDEETEELYKDKKSLLKLKITEVNAMYDKFINQSNADSKTLEIMQEELGTKDLNDEEKEKRIVNIEDKLPAYKHILMTEKYNFNYIKWKKYTHNESSGRDAKDDELQDDKELGLKFPKDDENTKIDKFIQMTLPYLQTWYIPLTMNTSSIVAGTGEDASRTPEFSYNIIKEAYSNIVVNWYVLQERQVVTEYQTYNKYTQHDILNDFVIIEYKDNNGDWHAMISNNSLNNRDFIVEKIEHIDTSTDTGFAEGKKDPMKEKLVSDDTTTRNTYYMERAETFDIKIINSFNYQVYLDSDVEKRINADSEHTVDSEYTKSDEREGNKYTSLSGVVEHQGTFANKEAILSYGPIANAKITAGSGTVGERTREYHYKIELPSYITYGNGLTHTVTRIWRDKLSQTGSEKSKYTIDDLVAYNQSDDRKQKVAPTDICGNGYISSSVGGGSGVVNSQAATEIKINGKTYPVYNQNNFGTTMHGGSSIAVAGCGLCSITAVINGITNQRLTPLEVGNRTNWTGAKMIEDYAADLRNVFGIECTSKTWNVRGCSGGPNSVAHNGTTAERQAIKAESKPEIDANLKAGNPVIIQVKGATARPFGTSSAHYIVLLGYEGGQVVIANSVGSGKQTSDLDTILSAMYDDAQTDHGYILVKGKMGSSNSNSNSEATSGSSSSSSSSSSINLSSVKGNQVITVENSGSNATVKCYEKNGSNWEEKISTSGFVGSNGTVNKDDMEEGGRATPQGLYDLGTGFGIKSKPSGVTYEYRNVTNLSNFVDDSNSEYYNQWVEEESNGRWSSAEHLIDYPGSYDYGVVINYNMNPVKKGKGSAIFLHCGNNATAGCVAVPTEKMIEILKWLDKSKSPQILISDSNIELSGNSSNSSSTVCDTADGKYYRDIEKTDGLNRIDFMNSNPEIYKRYIRDGAEYMDYVGYARSKLNLSYWNLKDMFQQVYDEKGTLPWAYGDTLGFENNYLNNKNGIGDASGEGLNAMVEEAISLAKMNNNTGIWHYCWGAAGGEANHTANARFLFSTIDELNNYISIGRSAGLDCSSFVWSMYKTYTGIDIDPLSHGGASIVSSARDYYNNQSLPDAPNVTVKYHSGIDNNIQPGDVIFQDGHVGLYVGKGEGSEFMVVDHGGGGVSGLCGLANNSDWTGPKYWASNPGSWLGYIHYEGIPSLATDGGTGASSGEFLIKPEKGGYTADKNYKGTTYKLSNSDRTLLERIVTREFGNDYDGSVLVAQCMRDALVNKIVSDPQELSINLYQCDIVALPNTITDNAKNAIKYVFDEGGSAIQHRIYVYYDTHDGFRSSWHEQQKFVYESPVPGMSHTVRFFDYNN